MRILAIGLTILMSFPLLAKADFSFPLDSVGHKWEGGKLYVLHQVEKGQTTFAISKRYGTTVDAIKQANGGTIDVKVGQIIKVPYSRYRQTGTTAAAKTPASETKPTENTLPIHNAGTHTVEVGNTLFNIAGRYGVSVADLKTWNGLTSDHVTLGQVLIVSKEKFSESNAPIKVNVTPDDTAKLVTPVKEYKPSPVSTPSVKMRTVTQQGLAEKIDAGGRNSPKYLALHRDAPIGTLVQVTNQANQEVIWVKVIGRIPETANNDDIVIKLSSNAFDKISPQTRRFRAEISYSDKATE